VFDNGMSGALTYHSAPGRLAPSSERGTMLCEDVMCEEVLGEAMRLRGGGSRRCVGTAR